MNELYPPIKPYHSGHLNVGDGHSIYYEVSGNPEGYPLILLHGGPGAGCGPQMRQFPSPKKWRIISFDQRGCGKSLPNKKLGQNTTPLLASDTVRLADHLKINKAVLVGGSWGSTLESYFAIHYPERVAGLVMWGVFLGEKSEINYLYEGGIADFCPKEWDRFVQRVPPEERGNVLAYFYRMMINGTPEEKAKFAYEMARLEEAALRLEKLTDAQIEKELADYQEAETIGLIEAHYFVNNCFMPEGFIVNNVHRLPRVPISIIQGQYDMVCPPVSAYRLAKALKEKKYDVRYSEVFSGHHKFDPNMQSKIVTEINRIHSLVTQKTL